MPKGCQNGNPNDAKTHYKSMPKLVLKKMMNNMTNDAFLNNKNANSLPIQANLKISQCLSANRKFINKTIKQIPKFISKSIKKQDKLHCRKSDAKNKENHQTWNPKGSRKRLESNKKQDQTNDGKKEAPPNLAWRTLCPRNTSKFKDSSSEDNLPKEKIQFRQMKFS